MCKKAVMTISRDSARGTLYHEAFHAVIDGLLSEKEIDRLMVEGSEKFGTDLNSVEGRVATEEALAESFRRYVQDEESPVAGFVMRVFRTLKHII